MIGDPPSEPAYDAFFSYAGEIDGGLARRTERFLESFHRVGLVRQLKLRPLKVCVDGSDFKIRTGDALESVQDLLARYLAEAQYLVVFCSARACASRFVDFEVRWFLEHRSAARILPVVTEGADPAGRPEEVFPPALIEAGCHQAVWLDFRGREPWRRRPAVSPERRVSVRPLEEERVKLAAQLHDESPAIVPSWERARRRRRQLAVAAAVAAVAVAAGGWGYTRTDRFAISRLLDRPVGTVLRENPGDERFALLARNGRGDQALRELAAIQDTAVRGTAYADTARRLLRSGHPAEAAKFVHPGLPLLCPLPASFEVLRFRCGGSEILEMAFATGEGAAATRYLDGVIPELGQMNQPIAPWEVTRVFGDSLLAYATDEQLERTLSGLANTPSEATFGLLATMLDSAIGPRVDRVVAAISAWRRPRPGSPCARTDPELQPSQCVEPKLVANLLATNAADRPRMSWLRWADEETAAAPSSAAGLCEALAAALSPRGVPLWRRPGAALERLLGAVRQRRAHCDPAVEKLTKQLGYEMAFTAAADPPGLSPFLHLIGPASPLGREARQRLFVALLAWLGTEGETYPEAAALAARRAELGLTAALPATDGEPPFIDVLLTGRFTPGTDPEDGLAICRNAAGAQALHYRGDDAASARAMDLARRRLREEVATARRESSLHGYESESLKRSRRCLVGALASTGRVEEALATAGGVTDPEDADQLMSDVVRLRAKAGDFAAASRLAASRIVDPTVRRAAEQEILRQWTAGLLGEKEP